MLIDKEEIDNPATHTRCKCGITYFHFDENPCLACDCDFFREYEHHRFGAEDDFEQSDSTFQNQYIKIPPKNARN